MADRGPRASSQHDGSKDWLDNYSVHKVPAVTPDGVHYTGDGAGEAWSVSAKSPNKDLALKFIAYIFRPDVYNWRAKGLQSFPALTSAVDQIDNPKVRTMIPWISDRRCGSHPLRAWQLGCGLQCLPEHP